MSGEMSLEGGQESTLLLQLQCPLLSPVIHVLAPSPLGPTSFPSPHPKIHSLALSFVRNILLSLVPSPNSPPLSLRVFASPSCSAFVVSLSPW